MFPAHTGSLEKRGKKEYKNKVKLSFFAHQLRGNIKGDRANFYFFKKCKYLIVAL